MRALFSTQDTQYKKGSLGRKRDKFGNKRNHFSSQQLCLSELRNALTLSIEDRLTDVPRPGKPSSITEVQRCQMATLACEAPEVAGRPISQWTGREIADEMVKRGIVPKISASYASQLVKKRG